MHNNIHWKAFTVFGFTSRPKELIERRLSDRLGIKPKVKKFGNAGNFFFYSSYGDVADSEGAMALKLGFARTPAKTPLSAKQLLEKKIATPQHIDHNALRGNYMIACFSNKVAEFTVFKNHLSLSQLYYHQKNGEFIGADNLAILTGFMDQVELNEDMIPFHFIFRHAPGTLTYINNVERLFPGQSLKWKKGRLNIETVQDLRFPDNEFFSEIDSHAAASLHQELKDIMEAYVNDAAKSGYNVANLLSGGVDSSVIQLLLNQCSAINKPAKTFSFVPEGVASFNFEVEYARHASKLLKTDHSFIKFTPQDYANMIVESIEILGQPVYTDVEPCKLFLAKALTKQAEDIRFYTVGTGADTLFGLSIAQKIKVLELINKIPGSELVLRATGTMLKPLSQRGDQLIKGADILSNNDLYVMPINSVAVRTNLNIARSAFGDDTIKKVLEYRRDLEELYLNSSDHAEKVHNIILLDDAYECVAISSQLFQAYNKEQIYPFMDDDVIRLSSMFPPKIRYVRGLKKTKPLLKDILLQNGLAELSHKSKGHSVFYSELFSWMRSGPLHDLIQSIDRPGFVSRKDFEKLLQKPDHFLWSLLTLDIFHKKVLKKNKRGQ